MLRIWEKCNGQCKGPCKRKLGPSDKWQGDHIVALINGGKNVESNYQVLCDWCHKDKTKQDIAIKAKIYAVKRKHVGIKKRGRTIPGRRFNGEPIPARWRS